MGKYIIPLSIIIIFQIIVHVKNVFIIQNKRKHNYKLYNYRDMIQSCT